jgi:cytidine deaminase
MTLKVLAGAIRYGREGRNKIVLVHGENYCPCGKCRQIYKNKVTN